MPQEPRDKPQAVVELIDLINALPVAETDRESDQAAEAIATFLRLLPPEDTAYTVSHVAEDEQTAMLAALSDHDPDLAADLLGHFVDEHAADMIEQLDPDTAAAIVDEMDSDEQVDVLAEMDADDAEAILQEMDPDEARDTRKRMQHEEDTAGGLMITEYLVFRDDKTVSEVTRELHQNAETYGEYEVRYLYVIDTQDRLVGTVPLRSLLIVPGSRLVSDLKILDPVKVDVQTHLDDLEGLFERIDYSAVPVTDADGKLLGIVQRAAVEEAVGERETETFMKFGGIVGGEELRSMSVASRALRRLAFLLPIMALLLLSALVIARFEETVHRLPILAAFLPLIAGLCGSGGNQAVAVSIRELSLGLIGPGDFYRVLRKELAVAVLIGLGLGAVLFSLVWIWQGNIHLALLLGVTVPFVMIISKSVGGTVPVLLRKIGIDPAMAAGPIVTTIVDIVGFFTVLILASMMLDKLS